MGFSVDLETSRNLLPAVVAQGAALLMRADRIGGHPTADQRVTGSCLYVPRSTPYAATAVFKTVVDHHHGPEWPASLSRCQFR